MISSILRSLSFWTYLSWGATFVVFVGVAGEVIAEFTGWIGSETKRKRVNRLSAFVLVGGLAGELLTLVMTSVLASAEIATLNKDAAEARLELKQIDIKASQRFFVKDKFLAALKGRPTGSIEILFKPK